MHKAMLVLVLVLLAMTSCGSQPNWRVEQIRVYLFGEDVGFGNAFVVGYDEYGTVLATAAHVVLAGDEVRVKTSQNSSEPFELKTEVLGVDEERDIAYVRVRGHIDGKYKVCSPQLHDEVLIPARHKGVWHHRQKDTGYRVVEGMVLHINGDEFLMDAKVLHGYSGSPIISKDRGCVIGLVSKLILSSRLSVGVSF